MVAIPPRPEQEIINRIYKSYENAESTELYLGRIGASFIGEECNRKIWLSWRAYARESFEGRMLRLFQTGHLQEDRIITDLRNSGLQVWDKKEDGTQYEFTDSTGHFIVKVDGIVKGVPQSEHKAHDLEAKTHNKNSFSSLVKKGVQEAKPLHYSQMQAGMLYGDLTRALYVALCKDDENYHIERVKECKTEQKKIDAKIKSIVGATLRPAGISDDGGSFGCKFCDMKTVCIKEVEPIKSCRSCVYAQPVENGQWLCNSSSNILTLDDQRKTCDHYEVL